MKCNGKKNILTAVERCSGSLPPRKTWPNRRTCRFCSNLSVSANVVGTCSLFFHVCSRLVSWNGMLLLTETCLKSQPVGHFTAISLADLPWHLLHIQTTGSILCFQVRAAILSSSTWGAIDNSYLYTDTPNAIGNSLLVDPLVTLCLETGADYVNITESNAK